MAKVSCPGPMMANPSNAGGRSRILVLFAHPAFEKSNANRALSEAIRGVEGLTFHDLYEEYPRFDIDVPREQALLAAHDVIVLQHPLFWYSCPALLKQWIDLVLEYGFAYGPGGEALRGKRLLSAVTAGGSIEAYCRTGDNRFTLRELLLPFEQTAALCGIEYLPPFAVFGALRRVRDGSILDDAQAYRTLLQELRDGACDPRKASARTPCGSLFELPMPG